jgi:hypothetical protein
MLNSEPSVVLVPPSFAIGTETKATLVAAGTDPRELKLASVRWEVRLGSVWAPLPRYSQPFPWDPHALVPNADMAGMAIRAVAIVIDEATDQPLLEYDEAAPPDEQGRRRARPKRFVTDQASVSVPPKLVAAAQKAATMAKFGFHASSPDGAARYVCLATRSPRQEHAGSDVELEVLQVPNDDKAAMQPVWRAPLLAAGSAPSGVCELSPADDVTLMLCAAGSSAAPAVAEPEPATTETGRFPVCMKSSADRDMVALCLRAMCDAATRDGGGELV